MKLPHKHKKAAAIFMFFVMLFSIAFGMDTGRFDAVSAETNKTKDRHYAEKYCSIYVSGMPIGLQMKADGVVVTGYLGFKNEANQFVNPSRDAGVMIGDRIIAISGTPVTSIQELQSCVAESDGTCILDVVRNKANYKIEMTPDISAESHKFKLGLWVKDSTAGIGTLTFINAKTGVYGALGHGIGGMDADTLFELSDGKMYSASIANIVPGKIGAPGELQGYFLNPESDGIGNIFKNDINGVYGTVGCEVLDDIGSYGVLMPVDDGSVVHVGTASVMTTVSGCEPAYYEIEILSLDNSECSETKNMSIRVTDEILLKETGGIVQGMSGSPIIQDGYVVGAVTHVLISDPTTGYGIFIENMLEN